MVGLLIQKSRAARRKTGSALEHRAPHKLWFTTGLLIFQKVQRNRQDTEKRPRQVLSATIVILRGFFSFFCIFISDKCVLRWTFIFPGTFSTHYTSKRLIFDLSPFIWSQTWISGHFPPVVAPLHPAKIPPCICLIWKVLLQFSFFSFFFYKGENLFQLSYPALWRQSAHLSQLHFWS